jgi:protein phosphatase 2C-like protein
LTEPAAESAEQPSRDGGPVELRTEAPSLGSLRPIPEPALATGLLHRVPAVAADAVRVGDLRLAAASLAGVGHLVGGVPRQDSYDFILLPSGRLVVVVVDGLGSCARSQVGARLLCEHAVRICAEETEVEAAACLLAAGEAMAEAAWRQYALKPGEVRVVAVLAVFSAEGCELARVGDATAFRLDGPGTFTELFDDDDGMLNVVTAALPGPVEPERATAEVTAPIVLTTDGLAIDLRNSAAVRSWLADRWRRPLGPYAMVDALRYRRQGSHDDRTGVVVWPEP